MTASNEVILSDLLIRHKVLDQEGIEHALAESRKRGISLREAIIGLDYCLEDQINWAISRELQIPFILLSAEMLDTELLARFPPEVLRETASIPIPDAMGGITLVMADPLNNFAFDRLATFTKQELHRAVGPSVRIFNILDTLPRSVTEVTLKEPAPKDISGVAAAYGMLVEAYRKGARRILIQQSEDGLLARLRLERGWIDFKCWSAEQALPIWTRCRIMAGLKPEMNVQRETSLTYARIEKRRVCIEFSFLRDTDSDSVTIDLYPIQPARDFTEFKTLVDKHLAVLAGLFTARRQTGVIVVNAQDEFQRYRMVYTMAKVLSARNLDIISIEPHIYFELSSVRRVQAELMQGNIEWFISQPADVVMAPSAPVKELRRLFETAGDRLVIIGLDFVNSCLTLRALGESVGSAALLTDRLRTIWTGRRIALTCPQCNGIEHKQRGSISADICPNCNGYGFDRFADFFDAVLPDESFRFRFSNIDSKENQPNWSERLTVEPSIAQQIRQGIDLGHIFNPAGDAGER